MLSLEREPPAVRTPVSTWAYPLHRKVRDAEGNEVLQLEPTFYNGLLREVYAMRGPSSKLQPPYYLTDIHLHGGSSGGPVFNQNGHVFGAASCSYDGATDVAFVTPVGPILEIELRDTDLGDGRGARNVLVSEIANLGRISFS